MNKNRLIGFLALLTIIGFGWGFYETKEMSARENAVESMRSRAFYDVLDSVEKLSVLSAKTLVSTDSAAKSDLFSQLNTESYVAQENLCQLPLYHNSLLRTEKFLNQMGDFSYSLMKATNRGRDLTPEERETLATLNTEVEKISSALHQLESSEEQPFTWEASAKAEKRVAENDLESASAAHSSLAEVTTNLDEVPSLTYDGPFSDELENVGPLELSGEEATWAQALAAARSLLGNDYQYEAYGRSSENAGIAVYTVNVMNGQGDTVGYMDVSRMGCHVVQYTADESGEKPTISPKKGLNIAEEFIGRTQYESMVSSYYIVERDVLTVNFLYHENGISVYPDMIKVSVDLTSGKVVGFDAKSYLKNHKDRDYNPEILNPDEVRANLGEGITPESEQLTIIPLDNGGEVLCYEYKFKYGNHEYLLYLNAETGREEDILTLITTDQGTITL